MKYEKAQANVIVFDYAEFLMGSLDPSGHCTDYSPDSQRHCNDFINGVSCAGWSSGTNRCDDYDGTTCSKYYYNGNGPYTDKWNCSKFRF